MPKLEYADLYRWTTSAGIVLLIAALLLPWFYLRQDLALNISQADYDAMTADGREVTERRSAVLLGLLPLIWCISIILGLLGLVITVVGLILWYQKVQKPTDERTGIELRQARDQLRKSQRPADEVLAEAEDAVLKLDDGGSSQASPAGSSHSVISRYLNAQKRVSERISSALKEDFESYRSVGFDNVTVDLVLLSRFVGTRDYIVDIKFVPSSTSRNAIDEAIHQSQDEADRYTRYGFGVADPSIIFVSSRGSAYARVAYEKSQDRQWLTDGARVEFVTLEELESLSDQQIREWFPIRRVRNADDRRRRRVSDP